MNNSSFEERLCEVKFKEPDVPEAIDTLILEYAKNQCKWRKIYRIACRVALPVAACFCCCFIYFSNGSKKLHDSSAVVIENAAWSSKIDEKMFDDIVALNVEMSDEYFSELAI